MESNIYQPRNKVRFVTAASLFDGHDVSINIMRRILQAAGAEVIHLGHNRSAAEVVEAAIQEDAQGIAVSSYQGGHVEYFKYMIDLLKQHGCGHIRVFGGGGGVITPAEARDMEIHGVVRVYSPEDGRKMGLQGIINHMLEQADFPVAANGFLDSAGVPAPHDKARLARLISHAESGHPGWPAYRASLAGKGDPDAPVVGFTGTGGAGKSSLTDEVVRRFLLDFPDLRLAVLSVDPSHRKSGGALLGDRIRMNAIYNPRVYMRSFATRQSGASLSPAIRDAITLCRAAGYGLIIVETSGIGQGESGVVDVSDIPVYVMTSEFGAATQLEKIDMLDFADLVAINKFDKPGSEDALRDVRRQVRRNRKWFDAPDEKLPVFGTVASKFQDPGVDSFYAALLRTLDQKTRFHRDSPFKGMSLTLPSYRSLIPPGRVRYLSGVAETLRAYHQKTGELSGLARRIQHLRTAGFELHGAAAEAVEKRRAELESQLEPAARDMLAAWPETARNYSREEITFDVRGKTIRVPRAVSSLSGLKIPKVALPHYNDEGDLLSWLRSENLPGSFPFTAGVFPFRRADEDPKRQFAGEGGPARTNRRFHFLSRDDRAKRLSTAFDSVTLYGEDPDERPDIFGKIGESGVSIATLDDMVRLYDGFDLCDPNTSVSMTINGPAPMILAMFFNTAIHQRLMKESGGRPEILDAGAREKIRADVLANVRGTVQADILKEDQAQNTCIFSTEFALRMMGDIQEYFVRNNVRNFYSVSISGYHIAEAGANPISQLAFTLANGFTYVEYYLSRGMKVDDFAHNLSFFFSNGLDPEYSVMGRVARRIWAVAMRDRYGAGERGQKLKYHIQTSGRSLHAQEVQFNDIRTTLQALIALYDNCNSLHTNAYDEAVSLPTEESVRRAMAIQMIINREFGMMKNENVLQGSFIIEELTRLVEEAVLAEFDRISLRGGVLGAMETQYQRSKIQEESLHYERLKHSGELPIIGVNTFVNPKLDENAEALLPKEIFRTSYEEKRECIANLRDFQRRHADSAPAALRRLQETAVSGGNVFEALMDTVLHASLGQISRALYEVGGQYRRNM
ncbi:MAG: Fused isobutyryl-CoA mutase [Myxococcota bacterium]|nr:Fused isobutyryl-CoA mutase [Myxococcota bacterium]